MRYLLIVARNQTDLRRYLKDSFAGDDKVEVILDRRRGERRRRIQPHEPERRRGARRPRLSVLGDLGFPLLVTIRQPQEGVWSPLPNRKETA